MLQLEVGFNLPLLPDVRPACLPSRGIPRNVKNVNRERPTTCRFSIETVLDVLGNNIWLGQGVPIIAGRLRPGES